MDDTTWIARSKKDIDSILDEARIFYKANDSQINGEKSVLIIINNPDSLPVQVQVGSKKKIVTAYTGDRRATHLSESHHHPHTRNCLISF